MSREVEVDWQWHDNLIIIRAKMAPPEHDVGIMSPYPETFEVYTEGGSPFPMTDSEIDELAEDPGLQDLLVEQYYEDMQPE